MNRNIRIFLSSTFADLQEERSFLVKKTIPMLKQYCHKRGVTLSVIDLRWGITESDSRNGRVVELCMDEIRRTRPFFVGIVGGRYGWQPDAAYLEQNEHLGNRYPWIRECMSDRMSITEMEIQYGVMRSKTPVNAFFFLGDGRPEWREEAGSERAERLARLKHRIRDIAVQGRCTVDDFTSPNDLGETFYSRIKAMIDTMFHDETKNNPVVQRIHRQESEFDRLRRVYVGETNLPFKFGEDDFCNLSRHPQHIVQIVCGPSGCGKSALLAQWCKNDIYQLSSSGFSAPILRTIVEKGCNNGRELKNNFYKQAELRGLDLNKPLVWILDGIDKIDNDKGFVYEKWLDDLPYRTIVIVSTSDVKEATTISGVNHCDIYEVPLLSDTSVYEMIQLYLKEVGKSLTTPQLFHISAAPMLRTPYVLKVFLGELIQYGDHNTLNDCIEHYLQATDGDALLNLVFERMEADFGETAVRNVIQTMVVCTDGASAHMTDPETPPLQWIAITGALEEVTRVEGDFVTFTIEAVRKVAYKRYLSDDSYWNQCTKRLITKLRKLSRRAFFSRDLRIHYESAILNVYQETGQIFKASRWMERHYHNTKNSVDSSYMITYMSNRPWLYNIISFPRVYFHFRKDIKITRNHFISDWNIFKYAIGIRSKEREMMDEFFSIMVSIANVEFIHEERIRNQNLLSRKTKNKDLLRLCIVADLQREGLWDEADNVLFECIRKNEKFPSYLIHIFQFERAFYERNVERCSQCFYSYNDSLPEEYYYTFGVFYENEKILMKIFDIALMINKREKFHQTLQDITESNLNHGEKIATWIMMRQGILELDHWYVRIVSCTVAQIFEYVFNHSTDKNQKERSIFYAAIEYHKGEEWENAVRCYRQCLDSPQYDIIDVLEVLGIMENIFREKLYLFKEALDVANEMWRWHEKIEESEFAFRKKYESIISQKMAANAYELWFQTYNNQDDYLWTMAMEYFNRSSSCWQEDISALNYNYFCMVKLLVSKKSLSPFDPWLKVVSKMDTPDGPVGQLSVAYIFRMMHLYNDALTIAGKMDDGVIDGFLPTRQYNLFAYDTVNEWNNPHCVDYPYPPNFPDGILDDFYSESLIGWDSLGEFKEYSRDKLKGREMLKKYKGTLLFNTLKERIEKQFAGWNDETMLLYTLPALYEAEGNHDKAIEIIDSNCRFVVLNRRPSAGDYFCYRSELFGKSYDWEEIASEITRIVEEEHIEDAMSIIAFFFIFARKRNSSYWRQMQRWLQSNNDRAVIIIHAMIVNLGKRYLANEDDNDAREMRNELEEMIKYFGEWFDVIVPSDKDQRTLREHLSLAIDAAYNADKLIDDGLWRKMYKRLGITSKNMQIIQSEDEQELTPEEIYMRYKEGEANPFDHDQFVTAVFAKQLAEANHFTEAAKHFANVHPKTWSFFEHFNGFGFKDGDFYLAFIDCLLYLGRIDDAVIQFEKYRACQNNNSVNWLPQWGELYFTKILIEQGLVEDAKVRFFQYRGYSKSNQKRNRKFDFWVELSKQPHLYIK